ncbi:MAG TPA: GGDEF domain-containing protein, partial [Gammaproteobacteria bacterium]|nr:GGDEF domain-containing protein [Gammaproteobacteria bacterium]
MSTLKIPDLPDDESSRLTTLNALNILDTEPEERFDRLTRIAKRLFDVPIALVSLVDENRQWFKSCIGLNVRQTDRNISFCGHAILGDGIFIIPNALKDERFADNPLVIDEPHIRFYAGCPISVPDGHKMGTLCIIDRKPRQLSQEDLELLQDLANMVGQELAALQMATLDELTGIANRRGFTL